MNIHENNENFIGYAIQQAPEIKDHRDYLNTHPYIVIFVFKNGPAHIVFYSPSGQVLGGEWKTLDKDHEVLKKVKPVSDLWHECRGKGLENKPNNLSHQDAASGVAA